jgi:hypothetical protein
MYLLLRASNIELAEERLQNEVHCQPSLYKRLKFILVNIIYVNV